MTVSMMEKGHLPTHILQSMIVIKESSAAMDDAMAMV